MTKILHNAVITTGESSRPGALSIKNGVIETIIYKDDEGYDAFIASCDDKEDLGGRTLLAGGIDAHVHFREPGMTHKATFASESAAALRGGVTSVIDMPNTNPPTTTGEHLNDKLRMAGTSSQVNYGFHIGATNSNLPEIQRLIKERPQDFGAIKVFMGSSTGDMLVDDGGTLSQLFRITDKPVFIHSEDESIIRSNLAAAKAEYGDDIPIRLHEDIRSRTACIKSTIKALEMAMRYGTRLHILHVTTKEEVEMIRTAKGYNPYITAETSANYLWFSDEDYDRLGTRIKCNPAVKTAADREALRSALKDGIIDTIGSDHAPHLIEEKERPYTSAPSGVPSIGESLPALLTIAKQCDIPLTRIASVFSERIASILGIEDRGVIAPGYAADFTVVNPDASATVGKPHYLCGWSPYEGETLTGIVEGVYLGGEKVIGPSGRAVSSRPRSSQLRFRPTGSSTESQSRE
ncbi:MAG: amidohydrolase family protein [Bacteroidales bacterium]|nr:amidohydrolase family protein [Bacteroidales bacterium]